MLEDDDFFTFNESLHRYFHNDPIYNPVAPDVEGPSRPPIRKILGLYGVNVYTDVGYTYHIGRASGLACRRRCV